MSPMRDGQTNEQTREDRATHPMEAGWLSFAIVVVVVKLPLAPFFNETLHNAHM